MVEEEVNKLPSVTEIISKTIAPKEELLSWVRRMERSGKDTLAILRRASKRGTRIHNLSSHLLENRKVKVPEKYQKMLNVLLTYLKTKKNLQCELLCWKEDCSVPYRGHIDYLFEDERGWVVADLKTGSRLQKTHELQLFGYKDAIESTKCIKVNVLELLHLTPEYLTVKTVSYEEGMWNKVLDFYSFLYNSRGTNEKKD